MSRELINYPTYQALDTRERIERLTGFSLDRCEHILIQPLDLILEQRNAALLLNAQVQCIRAILATVVKAGAHNNRLTAERERIIGEMHKREFGEKKAK